VLVQVVCREAGFSGTAVPANTYFGPTSSDQQYFWVGNVSCVGTESKLSDCAANEWYLALALALALATGLASALQA
jgi:hypothetical protein